MVNQSTLTAPPGLVVLSVVKSNIVDQIWNNDYTGNTSWLNI